MPIVAIIPNRGMLPVHYVAAFGGGAVSPFFVELLIYVPFQKESILR
jgi:hypothetical protein